MTGHFIVIDATGAEVHRERAPANHDAAVRRRETLEGQIAEGCSVEYVEDQSVSD